MALSTRNHVLAQEFDKLNRLVYYACCQVQLINNEMDQLNTRYNRAVHRENNSFRYSLRLRLATFEDTRTAILYYAKEKAK